MFSCPICGKEFEKSQSMKIHKCWHDEQYKECHIKARLGKSHDRFTCQWLSLIRKGKKFGKENKWGHHTKETKEKN